MSKSDKKNRYCKSYISSLSNDGSSNKKKSLSHIQGCGNKRWHFTDNYYTRHTLAKELKEFTDGEAHMIATCKMSIIDATHKENV